MQEVDSISVSELRIMAEKMYGNLVKAVVDLKLNKLIVDADQEQFLLEQGSDQNDLWGINLYPDKFDSKDFIEFDSMINIRPRQANMSRGVEDESLQKRIVDLVNQKVKL